MELDLDEQNLIATFRRLGESAKWEVIRFTSALCQEAKGSAAPSEGTTGTCKIAKEEVRPETAAEPPYTE